MISSESILTFWKQISFQILEETVEEYSREYLAGYWQEGDPSLVVTWLASAFSFVDVDHIGVLRCCGTFPFSHIELKSSVSFFMMIVPVCMALYFVSFLLSQWSCIARSFFWTVFLIWMSCTFHRETSGFLRCFLRTSPDCLEWQFFTAVSVSKERPYVLGHLCTGPWLAAPSVSSPAAFAIWPSPRDLGSGEFEVMTCAWLGFK